MNGPRPTSRFFGEGHLSAGVQACIPGGYGNSFGCEVRLKGLAIDGQSHTVYVANASAEANSNDIAVFPDARPVVTTHPPVAVTTSSVTFTGHIDPSGRGEVTECFFEYGFTKTYGSTVPCTPAIPPEYSAPTDVTANLRVLGRDPQSITASSSKRRRRHQLWRR